MGALARHQRFLAALAIGLALAVGLWAKAGMTPASATVLGFDLFALIYLALSLHHLRGLTAKHLQRRAVEEDEGMALIVTLVAAAVGISFWAIVQILNGESAGALTLGPALLAVPLGWVAVQTVAGFHYAHLHYLPASGTPLAFPGKADPGPWDFLYFAFTIGMTAQVSDVTVATTRLRRAVLLHSVLSFFYNTVILALAVNAGLKLI